MPSLNTAPSSAPIWSHMTMELSSFKTSIKREASAYSVLKDDCFFDEFQRDLLITAKSHDVSEVIYPLPSEDTTPEEQHDPHQFDGAPDSESDRILDYINSQHQEEDMNNALQPYNVMTSPTSDVTPHGSINSVCIHLFYHMAQSKTSPTRFTC